MKVILNILKYLYSHIIRLAHVYYVMTLRRTYHLKISNVNASWQQRCLLLGCQDNRKRQLPWGRCGLIVCLRPFLNNFSTSLYDILGTLDCKLKCPVPQWNKVFISLCLYGTHAFIASTRISTSLRMHNNYLIYGFSARWQNHKTSIVNVPLIKRKYRITWGMTIRDSIAA